MALKIADTSFATGPDNKAVTVDVYNKPPLTPFNNLPSDGNVELLGGILGSENKQLGFLATIAKRYATTGKLLPDKDTIIQNIGNHFGITKGNINSIGGKVLDNLLQANGFYNTGIGGAIDQLSKNLTGNSFSGSLKNGFSDITVFINDVKQDFTALKDLDFNNLSELSAAIGKITGDNEFIKLLNLTEAVSVVKALNDMATDLYIPGVADRLLGNMKEEDRKIAAGLFASSITHVSDLSTIQTLIKNLSPEEILNTNPNIIKHTVAGFQAGMKYKGPSVAAADELLTAISTINPNWNKFRTADGLLLDDLAIFKEFSTFARDCFVVAGYEVGALAIASSYSPQTFVRCAKATYPSAGIAEKT